MNPISVTVFRDVSGSRCDFYQWSVEELAEQIHAVKTYPQKADCPLLKLARFGTTRTEKGSLRNDSNVIDISGIEADYDGEKVSLQDAQMMLFEQNISAILYTSPSHTAEKPRWRVLCPLSQAYKPSERAKFVARLNGALGGILAPESFTLSQSYYAGRVKGAQYEAVQVRGEFIDHLNALDAKAIGPTKNGESKAERLDKLRSNDPVIARLKERGMLLHPRMDGGADIACPFEAEHTTPRSPSDCTYFPPNTGGFARGHFHCLHSHCAGRSDDDFRRALGMGQETQAPAPAGEYDERNPPPEGEERPIAPSKWPPSLDLEVLSEREPERPKFIIPDWLPVGYATLLAGHGGVGKSGIALNLAVCIAAGRPFFGLEAQRRRVLYLSCEDRESVLHWRLTRICAHLGIQLASLRGWLEVVDLVGLDTVLWERDPRSGNTVTPALGLLEERIKEHQSELLVVDGISDTFAGNENARTDVKRYVNALVSLIPADSGAVLLVGHIAKPSASNPATSEGYSGSTGWNNSARARWYLYPETTPGDDAGTPERTGGLLLQLQKSNLGRTDQEMSFSWDEEAHLFVGRCSEAQGPLERSIIDRTELDGIRRALKGCMDAGLHVPAAKQGQSTAYGTLSLRPEFPESLRGGARPKTRQFWRRIEMLRQLRHIEEGSYKRTNRHVVATMVLTTEGRAECV